MTSFPPPSPPPPPPPPIGAAPAPFPSSQEIRPSAWWYGIGSAIGIAFAILGVIVIVRAAIGFADKVDDFHRIETPGSEAVALDEGSHTVYFESFGAGDVAIRAPNERPVELRRYSSDVTYDVSGHHGRAVYSFRADVSGTYRVTTKGEGGVVAIGPGLGRGLVAGIVGGVVLILAGGAIALVIIIVTAVRRGRSRRAQFTARYPAVPPTVPR